MINPHFPLRKVKKLIEEYEEKRWKYQNKKHTGDMFLIS